MRERSDHRLDLRAEIVHRTRENADFVRAVVFNRVNLDLSLRVLGKGPRHIRHGTRHAAADAHGDDDADDERQGNAEHGETQLLIGAGAVLLAALRKIGVDIVNIVAGRDDPAPRSELQRIGALRREASRADILGLFPHEFVSSIQK